jgi:hypothetical protein
MSYDRVMQWLEDNPAEATPEKEKQLANLMREVCIYTYTHIWNTHVGRQVGVEVLCYAFVDAINNGETFCVGQGDAHGD